MKPILQALLVADHVYADGITGKKIVVGIFHQLLIQTAPASKPPGETPPAQMELKIDPRGHRAGSPFCYISLTDIHGEQKFELRFVNIDGEEALFATEFGIKCNNPLETVEISLALPYLPVFKPGHFAIELFWNNELLGAHRIIASPIDLEATDHAN